MTPKSGLKDEVKRILKKEAIKLTESSKLILNKAIKAGGTTLQDFLSPDGNKGYFKIDLKVYGRNEENCDVCKSSIKLIKQKSKSDLLLSDVSTLGKLFIKC